MNLALRQFGLCFVGIASVCVVSIAAGKNADMQADNGQVAVELKLVDGAVEMTFKALSADGSWQNVCRSFRPDMAAHPQGNRFFDTTITTSRCQAGEIVSDFAIVKQSPKETVLRLWGMRTHPSWGECSGVFTGLADADRLLQGAQKTVSQGAASTGR